MLGLLTRAIFIAVKSTLLEVVKNGRFAMWTSLAEKNTIKFLEISEAAALVHMDQAHKNTCSTRTTVHAFSVEEYVEDMPIAQHERKIYIFVEMGDNVPGKIDTNQKTAFPVVSSKVNC